MLLSDNANVSRKIIGALAAVFLLSACNPTSLIPDCFLIPKGYVGWAAVDYYVKGAPPLPMENGQYIMKVPATGWLQTSSNRQWKQFVGSFYSYSGDSRKPLPQAGDGQMIWGGREGIGDPEFRGRPHKDGSIGGNVIIRDMFFVGSKQEFRECCLAADEMGNGPGFDSIEEYTRKIKDNPNNFQAYNFRGRYYAAVGPSHYQQALDDFTQEIELAQKYAEANGSLSTISHPGYVQRENTKYYVRDSYSELQNTNYYIRDAYCKRAQVYVRAGQYQKAIDDCTKSINMIPNLAEMYWRQAAAEKVLGCDGEAKADLAKAIGLDPAKTRKKPLPAKVYGDRRQLSNIRIDCTSEIMRHGSHYEPYFFRGVAYAGLGKNREAIADLGKAIDCKPKNWRLYNMRGSAYEELEQYPQAVDDYTQAITLIKNGFQFIGQRVAILNHRADCYEEMGKLDLAKSDRYKAAHQSDINERK